jgi:hypothetical protein
MACDGYMDALICPVIIGHRTIIRSSAISLDNHVLTRAEGFLDINNNNILTRINFSSLSYVGGFLQVAVNPALTFASLPFLSQVQSNINFCQNNSVFRIPNPDSGTAAAPGLTSVLAKGTHNCFYQNGSETCTNAFVTCP